MKRLTTEEFIKRSKNSHKIKYDYSMTEYKGLNTAVVIICPIHGKFTQMAIYHIRGSNCPMCGKINRKENNKRSFKSFVEEANYVHNNFYFYSKIGFNGTKDDVNVVCPIHGKFSIYGRSHLEGIGCKQCSSIKKSKMQTKDTEWFLNKALNVHFDFYDYSKSKYINSQEKVEIICPIHGTFFQKPANHLQGQNCPKCNTGGWGRERFEGIPAILYYIMINDKFFKIGITTRSVKERFSQDIFNGVKIDIIFEHVYEHGQMAFDEEKRIKRTYKKHKIDKNILLSGNSEIFNKNILNAKKYK